MENRPKTTVQLELEKKEPNIVPYTTIKYRNEEDQQEHLWWGKDCPHCREQMTEKTTTLVSKKNGWGFQRCDYCLINCVTAYPCEKWSQEMKEFFTREGFIAFDLFFENGKRKPMTGKAARP